MMDREVYLKNPENSAFQHHEPKGFQDRLAFLFVKFLRFFAVYFLLYIFSQKTAHRFVGYLEEEAVLSYTQYLDLIDRGAVENVPAPDIAVKYWHLPQEARLRDVVIAIRADEMKHRDVNH